MLTPPSSSSVESEAAAAAAAAAAASAAAVAAGVRLPRATSSASASSLRRVTFHPLVTQIEIEVEAEEDEENEEEDGEDGYGHDNHGDDSSNANSRAAAAAAAAAVTDSDDDDDDDDDGDGDRDAGDPRAAANQRPQELHQGAQQQQLLPQYGGDDDASNDGGNGGAYGRRRRASAPGSGAGGRFDGENAVSDSAAAESSDTAALGLSRRAAQQQHVHSTAAAEGVGAARARRPVLGSEVDEDLGLGEVVYPAGSFSKAAGKPSGAHQLAPHSLPSSNGTALWGGDTLSPIGGTGAAAGAGRPGAPRAGDDSGVGVDVELAAVMGSPVPNGEAAAQLLQHGAAPSQGSTPLFRPSAGAGASDDPAAASRPSGRVAPSPQLPDWVRALQLTEPSADRALALRGAMHPAPSRAAGDGALAMRSLSTSVAHEVGNLFARLGIATRRS